MHTFSSLKSYAGCFFHSPLTPSLPKWNPLNSETLWTGSGIREERWWGLTGKRLPEWQNQVWHPSRRTARGRKEGGRTQRPRCRGVPGREGQASETGERPARPPDRCPGANTVDSLSSFHARLGILSPWELVTAATERRTPASGRPQWSSGGGQVWGWAPVLGLRPSALFLQDSAWLLPQASESGMQETRFLFATCRGVLASLVSL